MRACAAGLRRILFETAMRRAFTLFEVVLVLAILVVLAALSYPSLESMYGGYRVQAAADALRSSWAEARTHAMEEGRAYRFSVVMGKGNYRLAPDTADFWSGNPAPAAGAVNQPLIDNGALPKGIRFRRADSPRGEGDGDTVLPSDGIDPSQWSSLAVFLPDGTAKDDVAVVLEMSGARPLVVRLRALTGGVSVRPLAEGQR
jgi:prepilin-type N-terminal cleavage/methylation domain-containing protein